MLHFQDPQSESSSDSSDSDSSSDDSSMTTDTSRSSPISHTDDDVTPKLEATVQKQGATDNEKSEEIFKVIDGDREQPSTSETTPNESDATAPSITPPVDMPPVKRKPGRPAKPRPPGAPMPIKRPYIKKGKAPKPVGNGVNGGTGIHGVDGDGAPIVKRKPGRPPGSKSSSIRLPIKPRPTVLRVKQGPGRPRIHKKDDFKNKAIRSKPLIRHPRREHVVKDIVENDRPDVLSSLPPLKSSTNCNFTDGFPNSMNKKENNSPVEIRSYWCPSASVKPIIDQVQITDVTMNNMTITVRECPLGNGFFKMNEDGD